MKFAEIILEINSNTNKKVAFDPKQMAKTKELLRKIISKERNSNNKKRFENLLGLISGKYPNAKTMIASIKGMKKIINEFSALTEAVEKGNKARTIRKLVAATLLALTFAINVLSCSVFTDLIPTQDPSKIWDEYSKYIENP